jgi:hypothetical protein
MNRAQFSQQELERFFLLFLYTEGQDFDGLRVGVQLKSRELGLLFGVEGEVVACDDALTLDAEGLAVNSFHYYIDSIHQQFKLRTD